MKSLNWLWLLLGGMIAGIFLAPTIMPMLQKTFPSIFTPSTTGSQTTS